MATMTFSQFARHIRGVGKTVEKNGGLLVRRAALAIDRKLVRKTPVDTGLARSNWLVGINRERTEIGPILGVVGAIATGKMALTAVKTGDTVTISNNVPYIGMLNAGWSKQAPAEFVELIVIEAAAKLGRDVDITKEVTEE